MARKVFISFLGKTNYLNCIYSFDNGEKSVPVRFVQEAIIRHVCCDWDSNDKILIFYTSKEKTNIIGSEINWVDNGHKNTVEDIEKIGLNHRLNDLKKNNLLKADFEGVDIQAGFSEQEIWSIFETVYEKLKPSDEIYFDVTHAFRSIPMFSVVLFNYSKFMISTSLKAIYYGAFESIGEFSEIKKMPVEERVAPIINLTDIALLQEYNQIASELKNFGRVKALSNVITQTETESFNKTIKDLSNSMNQLDEYITTIDLNNIKKGKYIVGFNNNYMFLKRKKVLPKPIENILDELKELTSAFKAEDNYTNIEAAINWTIKHEMLMQTYPLAEEYILMLLANHFKDLKPTQLSDKNYREFIGSILGASKEDIENQKWLGIVAKYPDVANILSKESFIMGIKPYYEPIRKYRNSLAHGNGSVKYKTLKENVDIIKKCIEYIKDYPSSPEEKSLKFINFTNHPSSVWSEAQLDDAHEYGDIIDLPFPDIDETIDEAGIDSLTDNYLAQIKELSGGEPCTVHIMGEMTFTYSMINKLKDAGYTCVASTSKRDVVLLPDGSKQVRFNFCRFRKY